VTEPMIKLEPNGQAPVISYKLPEATSYAGRHYIELDLRPEDFLDEIAAPQRDDAIASGVLHTVGRREGIGSIVAGPDVLAIDEATDGSLKISATRPLSEHLAALTADTVDALSREGRDVVLVPNLAGNLDYRVSAQALKKGEGTGEDPTSSGGDGGPPKILVTIDTPAPNAELTGPSDGMVVTVEGGAEVFRGFGFVRKVQVRIDGEAWLDALQPPGVTDWSSWTATFLVTSSGLHTIEAKGLHSSSTSATGTAKVTVRTKLTAPPSNDSTAPTLAVTQPLDGTTVVKADGNAVVRVTGTAQDAGGVASVAVAVDNGVAAVAAPKAPGDWSSWAIDVGVGGPGPHVLTAICRDQAGNEQRQAVHVTVAATAPRVLIGRRLMLVESYRLSSFLGRYGAGRTIKTFSLLPGEKTKINVRTYRRSEDSAKQASSILDSLTDSSSKEFTDSLAVEQSNKQSHDDSFKYQVSAKVEQGWGTGRAEVSGGVSGGANAAREEFAKTVTNVTSKHAAQASAKRDVQVNNDYTSKVETGEETSIEREIQNINVGRTLNFVFRQMNQEFVSILHLVDVRLAVARLYQVAGKAEPEIEYQEVRLPEMQSLIAKTIVPKQQQKAYETVIGLLENVPDHQDKLFNVIEHVEPTKGGQPVPEAGYLRFNHGLRETYVDAITGSSWDVPGVIVGVTTNVLRTEGVVVDALLGQGEGLDDYSRGLQQAAVGERVLRNKELEQEISDRQLVSKIVTDKDDDAADVYEKVHPPTPATLALTVSNGHDNGSGPTP
jgi:Bacterial Ig domain